MAEKTEVRMHVLGHDKESRNLKPPPHTHTRKHTHKYTQIPSGVFYLYTQETDMLISSVPVFKHK